MTAAKLTKMFIYNLVIMSLQADKTLNYASSGTKQH
jgi:hypothetical protein